MPLIRSDVILSADMPKNFNQLLQKTAEKSAKHEARVRGVVEVVAVDRVTMRQLNRSYRGINRPTDVLSFAWQEDATIPGALLGQVYLCYAYIVDQAKRFGVSSEEETVRMLAHGLLHITGHDHKKKKEAAVMFALQERIVGDVFKS